MNQHGRWHLAVIIPARDEQGLLPRCLRSVQAAQALLPAGVSSDIVVVSDRSTDWTVQIARQTLRDRGAVLVTQAGNVGVARALGAAAAVRRSHGDTAHCWLANTDADCAVPETWLLQQLHAAERGCCAIAGTVDVDCFVEHLPVVESRFRSSYVIHADGTHPHVHGANLGIRADIYLRVGGWNPLRTAEDHDLWKRIRDLDTSLQSDAALQVLTSGRRVGRAPSGFAAALALHNGPQPQEVAA